MAELHPPATPTSQLSWDAASRTYSGEISSTNGFGPVYDDSIDIGLTLVGTTGRETVFVVAHTCYRQGECIGWTLVPADGKLPGVLLVLFND